MKLGNSIYTEIEEGSRPVSRFGSRVGVMAFENPHSGFYFKETCC